MHLHDSTIQAAREGDERAMRTLIQWWAWNDPNGLWHEALATIDGASEYDNPEGWNPMEVCAEVADMTTEYLAEVK